MECSYFGLAEHSENCVHECIVTDRCLFWQTLRIVASSLRGDRAENFYFRTKRFLLLIKAVLFQISGLERISLHSGAIFPEFVGPHRNALRGIDATNVNTTTFFCFKKNPVFCSRLSDTPPQKRHQAACHLYASHSSSLFRASRK